MIARRDLPVRLIARTDLSPTCFRLELAAEETITAAPGQFGMLSCGSGYDPLLRRAFSLSGVRPHGAGCVIELMIKEVGKGTSALRRLPEESELRLLAPLGNTFTLATDRGAPLALVAGGIGLPPVLFAAEELAARGVPFDLYLGAAGAGELLEVGRCRAAVEVVGGEFVLATDDGSRGETGFVTEALARRLSAGRRYGRALGCGPTPMLAALAEAAKGGGFEAELSLEEPMACGVGVCLGCVVKVADGHYAPTCKEGPVFPASALAEGWWK